jgi:hypothetical protein
MPPPWIAQERAREVSLGGNAHVSLYPLAGIFGFQPLPVDVFIKRLLDKCFKF